MTTLEEMSLEELRALAAKVRDRQKELKKSGKANERKIGTLARRRERLMERVREIDQHIENLRQDVTSVTLAGAAPPWPSPEKRASCGSLTLNDEQHFAPRACR